MVCFLTLIQKFCTKFELKNKYIIMISFIINLLITATSAYILGQYVLDGVHFSGFSSAVIFALILGLLNAIVKPILVVLTIPVTILTLGLFLLIINAVMVMLASYFMSSFNVDSFWWALGFSILLSILTSVIGNLIGE